MTLPIQYAFEGHEVRALMINGEPWFVASDVLDALQLDRKALERLDDDEKGVNSIHTLGGKQEMRVINEPGLYSLVLGSRKAEAKRFKRWVTHEVLPALRKHGAYVMPTAEPSEPADAPMAAHVEADQIVSAGRVFRAMFTTARSMGMARRLAATRANQAAERATGIDLAAELGASEWLDGPDMPTSQRKHYELQQQLRAHLAANDWPQGFTALQVAQSLGIEENRGSLISIGRCLNMLGYTRVRTYPQGQNGPSPWVYRLKHLALQQEAAA